MKIPAMRYAALPAALGLAVSLGMASPAAADSTMEQAAQAAVDQFGGCTINVEEDDYDGKPAFEVELKKTNVDNAANGRIEVKVDKASGKVVNKEDADSDDGEECDPKYASALSDDGDDSDNGDSEDSGNTENSDSDKADSSGTSGDSDNGDSQTGMDDELAETGPESAGLYGGIAALALFAGAGLMVVRRKTRS